MIKFVTFHLNQVEIKYTNVNALQIFSETVRFVNICMHFDARAPGDFFDSISEQSHVYQL